MSDRIEEADLAPELRIARDYQKRIDALLARIEELEAKEPEDSPEWAEEHRARMIAEAKVEALTVAGDGMAEYNKALEQLCAAYRLGRAPAGKTFAVLDKHGVTKALAVWEKAKE